MTQISCTFSWLVPITAGSQCDPHSHACTEIVYSLHASGMLHQRGQTLPYGHQSVFVYQPQTEHWVENRRAGEHLCIGVVGCQSDRLPDGVWPASSELSKTFDRIAKVLRQQPPLQPLFLDLLCGLVVCELLSQQPAAVARPKTRAQQARDLIEGGLTCPLSLKELAERVYVSQDYLRYLFRQEFGESMTSYIVRRRIDLAGRLLRSTNEPVKVIASQAGFPNEYYFSRMFRKVTGQSPTQWRQRP